MCMELPTVKMPWLPGRLHNLTMFPYDRAGGAMMAIKAGCTGYLSVHSRGTAVSHEQSRASNEFATLVRSC